MSTVVGRWPDPDRGPWLIKTHWAIVDGCATIVGLDVRSFNFSGTPVDGIRFAEVTQAVLRGIPIREVRERARAALAEPTQVGGALPAAVSFTVRGQLRRRQPPASDELLRWVASTYAASVRSGSKTPARDVEADLLAAGRPANSGQVRKWIQRARVLGYLPRFGDGGSAA